MGFKDNRKHPPVSPTALSAVSKIQNRDISIQKTDSKDSFSQCRESPHYYHPHQ